MLLEIRSARNSRTPGATAKSGFCARNCAILCCNTPRRSSKSAGCRSTTRPDWRRERMRSSRSVISAGERSAEITICLPWSIRALNVWKNSSCVLSLPAMNWTSSTINTSTERNSCLKLIVSFSRKAWIKRYMNCSADRYSTRRCGWLA